MLSVPFARSLMLRLLAQRLTAMAEGMKRGSNVVHCFTSKEFSMPEILLTERSISERRVEGVIIRKTGILAFSTKSIELMGNLSFNFHMKSLTTRSFVRIFGLLLQRGIIRVRSASEEEVQSPFEQDPKASA